jgi:hypothetical protein
MEQIELPKSIPTDVSKFGKGGKKHKVKLSHKRLELILQKGIGAGVLPDLDTLFGGNVKNQGSSGSCGGQATAYDVGGGQAQITGTYNERSAKSVYSNVHLEPEGSLIPDLIAYSSNTGLNLETEVPSYKANGVPPDEPFMQDKSWDSPTLQDPFKNALIDQPYYFDATNQQTLLSALALNRGAIIAVGGTNPCWASAMIEAPENPDWWHLIKLLKAVSINGVTYIKFINSWGKPGDTYGGWGENGRGYLPLSYFTNNLVSQGVVNLPVPLGEYTLLMQIISIYKQIIEKLKGN